MFVNLTVHRMLHLMSSSDGDVSLSLQAFKYTLVKVDFSVTRDRQCTYKVTLLCVSIVIGSVEVQYVRTLGVCVCVCSLSYPARKAHAPYYVVICGLFGCATFLHIIS